MSLPISGFMPIPLAIMPPFMAYQSLVMGDAFGRAFQFGKRKISAMSNEEFNALTISKMFEEISNEYTRAIPIVEKSMAASLELQVTIVKELLKTLPAIGQMLNELGVSATGKTLDELAHLIGMHFGHGETSPTPIPEPTPIQPSPIVPPIEVPSTQFTEAQKTAKISEIQQIYEIISQAQMWLNQVNSTGNESRGTKIELQAKVKKFTDALSLSIKSATAGGMSGTIITIKVWYQNQLLDGGSITIP